MSVDVGTMLAPTSPDVAGGPRADKAASRVRVAIAVAGVVAAAVSAAWMDAGDWPVYAVFFALAFAFSFVWADSDSPTSVPYMATATAFIYIGGAPILTLELLSRACAYPLIFLAADRGLLQLPRPLRAVVDRDRRRALAARLDLATMLGLASIGSIVRLGMVYLAHRAGVASAMTSILVAELTAYLVMGGLSARLPLPSSDYIVRSPLQLPPDDERVDVIFSAVLIVPFLVLLINYGYLSHGLAGAAAWSIATLAPHGLVQLLVKRRQLLVERTHELERKHQEVERSREELEAAYRRLQATQRRLLQNEKLASLGQLVAGVAHEINNPVSFIVGNLGPVRQKLRALEDAVARGDDDGALRLAHRVMRIFDTIGRGAERTASIVQDLRSFSRVGDAARVPCDVVESLDLSLRLLKPRWDGRIVVERDYREPLIVHGVPGQLNQVFMNVLANACDAIDDTGTVRVVTRHDAAEACVTIADTGSGIADEHLSRIFDPFFTTKAQGRGTGLGLSISHGIIEDHGGRIEVETRVGHGSQFTIRLPLR